MAALMLSLTQPYSIMHMGLTLALIHPHAGRKPREDTPSQRYPITSPNLCSLNMSPGWRPDALDAAVNVKFGRRTGRNVSSIANEPSALWNKNMPIRLLNNSSGSVIWILGGNAAYL